MIWIGRSVAADQLDQPLNVLQDQAGTLVSGEPAGKADRQRVQVQRLHGTFDGGVGFVAAPGLRHQAVADEVDQPGFQDLLRLPQLGVLNRLDPFPSFGKPLALGPVGPQVPVEEQVHLRRDPALDVNPVGDVADRDVLLGRVDEERLPHPSRDRAVQRTDAVGIPR